MHQEMIEILSHAVENRASSTANWARGGGGFPIPSWAPKTVEPPTCWQKSQGRFHEGASTMLNCVASGAEESEQISNTALFINACSTAANSLSSAMVFCNRRQRLGH